MKKIIRKIIRFRFDRDRITFPAGRAWILKIYLGRGAGYIWGRTFYLGYLPTPRSPYDRRTGLVCDFTRNANTVPYAIH